MALNQRCEDFTKAQARKHGVIPGRCELGVASAMCANLFPSHKRKYRIFLGPPPVHSGLSHTGQVGRPGGPFLSLRTWTKAPDLIAALVSLPGSAAQRQQQSHGQEDQRAP